MPEIEAATWEKFSQLKPQLRPHLNSYQHTYRGQNWWIIADPISGRHFRCPEVVFDFLAHLDGYCSVDTAYQGLSRQLPGNEPLPTQAEIVQLLLHLMEKELLQGDLPVTSAELYQRVNSRQQTQRFQRWTRPLSFKLPLWDPDTTLERLRPYSRWIFSSPFFYLLVLLIGVGGSLAVSHWPALSEHWSVRFLNPQNLMLLWLVYPLVKGLHELAHALAIKVFGGEVHELGVLFLVFVPVPYVDASSSHQFADKRQRMLVAAAGILVELLLSALALIVWVFIDDGLFRDLAFNVAVIGGLSTVLVNGNPLLRFDGYYVFADAIEIPNLAARSSRYLNFWLQRLTLGVQGLSSPVTAKGEAAWFACYGLAAMAYRLLISIGIALLVASKFFTLGLLLALWFVLQQLVWPIFGVIKELVKLARQHQRLRRLSTLSLVVSTVMCALLFGYPVNSAIHLQGLVAVPQDATIRLDEAGFVQQLLVSDGDNVQVGQRLLQLSQPALLAQRQSTAAKLEELQARMSEATGDQVQVQILQDSIAFTRNALALLTRRVEALAVRSPVTGRISLPAAQNLLGHYLTKGANLGQVVDLDRLVIQVLIPQSKLQALQSVTEQVLVKVHSAPNRVLHGTLSQATPNATRQLPSASLGSVGGGDINTDARDRSGLTSTENIYQLEISLHDYPFDFLAGKAELMFHSESQVLAEFVYQTLRRFVLQEFQN